MASPHHHPTVTNLPPESVTIHCLGPASVDLEPILHELRSQRDEYQHLVEEIESVKVNVVNFSVRKVVVFKQISCEMQKIKNG